MLARHRSRVPDLRRRVLPFYRWARGPADARPRASPGGLAALCRQHRSGRRMPDMGSSWC